MTAQVGHAVVYCAVALLLLTIAGNWACRIFINLAGLNDALAAAADAARTSAEAQAKAGRYIGGLERSVVAIGILTHRWEAVAAVIALKTIARFKELDRQIPAEYFLVGSLFSLLWAVGVTLAWTIYDAKAGMHLAAALTALLGKA